MDVTAVAAVLSNIKTASEIAKFIKDSGISLDKAETKLKLVELMEALAEARLDVVTLQEKLLVAEAKIRELDNELQIQGAVRWDEPFYWLEQNSEKDGPFCQHCYDDKRKLVRLQGDGLGYYECKVCKSSYITNAMRRREAEETARDAEAYRRTRGY